MSTVVAMAAEELKASDYKATLVSVGVAPENFTSLDAVTPEGFTDNLGEALAKAKAEGKLVYVCFSGSDWCGWCIKLEREVLSKSEFIDGVKNDFVLVYLDSPRNKSLLSEYAKKANKGLAKKYGIRGYPTALILDGEGNTVGKTGYRKGGAEAYVKHLMKYRTTRKELGK